MPDLLGVFCFISCVSREAADRHVTGFGGAHGRTAAPAEWRVVTAELCLHSDFASDACWTHTMYSNAQKSRVVPLRARCRDDWRSNACNLSCPSCGMVMVTTISRGDELRSDARAAGSVGAGTVGHRAGSSDSRHAPRAERGGPGVALALKLLILAVGASLLLQGCAVTASRNGAFGLGLFLYFAAVVLPFAVGVAGLLNSGLSTSARRWVVLVLGLTPTVLYRLTDPFLVTGFDEQLHMRTLNDLLHGAPLFAPNPLLPTSANYPGMEVLTLGLQRATHLPAMATVTIIVLLCRVILVLAIYRLALLVTRDERSASLAVAFYAASPQFYFFNSQYAYQTLALSLAVCGLLLLGRALRGRDARRRQALAAVLCFAGAVVTHHLTSWTAAAVLLVMTALVPKRDRRLVGVVAGVTTTLAVLWAIPIALRLQDYLGPVFSQALSQVTGLAGGKSQRTYFADSAGASTPGWERIALIAYAGICTVSAIVAGVLIIRRARRERSPMLFCLGLLCLAYPANFAARLAPKASEISDRATTFAFLPLALGLALLVGILTTRAGDGAPKVTRIPPLVAAAFVFVTSLGYLGGLILGSGPDWGRLPGSYLVVADSRSLDPETLAAVRWSHDNLTPGELIMADRVPGTLLSSVARMWVDSGPRAGVEPGTLYFSETWGPEQTNTVRAMGLRYLYVDTRLADSLPHQKWYFYTGETPDGRKLTGSALTKFAAVPEITAVYQHGPVAIYDLQGVWGPEGYAQSCGWVGTWHQHPLRDASTGLLAGMLLAWRWALVRQKAARVVAALGGVGAASVAMVAVLMLTGLATYFGFQPGWLLFVGLVLPPLATMPLRRSPTAKSVPRRSIHRPDAATAAVAVTAAILGLVGVGLALHSAWLTDFMETARILAFVRGGPA